MKKLLFVLLLVTMLFAGATPAFAANADAARRRGTLFTFSGRIAAIEGSTVTVTVYTGSAVVRPYLGETLAIETTASTRFLRKIPDCTITITLDDLVVGDKVSVQGSVATGVWTATRITADANLIHW